jgi:hypothetical protein
VYADFRFNAITTASLMNMMRAPKGPRAVLQLIRVLLEDSCMPAGTGEKLECKIHGELGWASDQPEFTKKVAQHSLNKISID